MINIESGADLANIMFNNSLLNMDTDKIVTLETFEFFKVYYVINGGKLSNKLNGKFITCERKMNADSENIFNYVWVNPFSRPKEYEKDFPIEEKETVIVIDILDIKLFKRPLREYLDKPLRITKEDDFRLTLLTPVIVEGDYNKEVYTLYTFTSNYKLNIIIKDKLDEFESILSETEINWTPELTDYQKVLDCYFIKSDTINLNGYKNKGDFLSLVLYSTPTDILIDDMFSPSKILDRFFKLVTYEQGQTLMKLYDSKEESLANYVLFEDIIREIFKKEEFMSLESFTTTHEAGMAYALRFKLGVSFEESIGLLRSISNTLKSDYKHFCKCYNIGKDKSINVDYKTLNSLFQIYRQELIYGSHPDLISFDSLIHGYCNQVTVMFETELNNRACI